MENCLWITKISDCKDSKKLTIIAITGVLLYTLFLISLLLITFFKYFNNKFTKLGKNRFFEHLTISIIILIIIRIIYLIALINNSIKKIWVITLLQELYWGISLYILIVIFNILLNLIPNITINEKKKSSVLYILLFLLYSVNLYLSIKSGILIQNNSFILAYNFIAFQFLIYSIYWIVLGTLYIIYFRKLLNFFNSHKDISTSLKIKNSIISFKNSIYCLIYCFYLFSPLWFMQSIILLVDPLYYIKNINLQIFISIFWYFGGDSFFIIIFIYYYIKW